MTERKRGNFKKNFSNVIIECVNFKNYSPSCVSLHKKEIREFPWLLEHGKRDIEMQIYVIHYASDLKFRSMRAHGAILLKILREKRRR